MTRLLKHRKQHTPVKLARDWKSITFKSPLRWFKQVREIKGKKVRRRVVSDKPLIHTAEEKSEVWIPLGFGHHGGWK